MVFLTYLYSCGQRGAIEQRANFRFDAQIREYIHGDSINSRFYLADSLKVEGEFNLAEQAFLRIMKNDQLSADERTYAHNQWLFCRLFREETKDLDSVETILQSQSVNHVSDPIKVDITYNQGKYALLQGRGDSAISYLRTSLSLTKRIYGSNHFKTFLISRDIAQYHRQFSLRIDSAVYYMKTALNIAETVFGGGKLLRDVRLGVAQLSLVDRDFITGLNLIDLTLDEFNAIKNEDSAFWARCLLVKARILRQQGKPEEVTKNLDHVGAILNQVRGYHSVLAEYYSQAIFHAASLKDSTIMIRYVNQFEQLQDVPSGYFNVNRLQGYYYYIAGDYRKAITYYLQMVAQFEGLAHYDIIQLQEAYFALADSFEKTDQYEQAEKYAYESLIYETRYRGTPLDWEVITSPEVVGSRYNFINYGNLVRIYLRDFIAGRGNEQSLLKAWEISNIIDSVLFKQVKVVEEDALLKFLQIGHGIYGNAIEVGYHLYQQTQSREYINGVYTMMERSKGLIMYRDILSNKDGMFPDVPESMRRRELELKSAISAIKSNQSSGQSSHDESEFRRLLTEQTLLYQQMEEQYPDYYNQKYGLDVVSVEQVIGYGRSTKAAFIEYHWSRDYLYQLILTDEPLLVRLPLDSTFQRDLEEFERLLNIPNVTGKEQYQNFIALSTGLHYKLINPIKEDIQRFQKLVVIPDGPLSTFPFEALVGQGNKTDKVDYRSLNYLVKEFEITYAPSIKSAFSSRRDLDFSTARVLAYAYSSAEDETYDNGGLSELPYSVEEVEAITKLYQEEGNVYRYGKASTKDQFVVDMTGDFQIIHLALHASSSETDKLDNKIHFRSPTIGGEEQLFYGYEALPMDFNGSLVFLSSCESAQGKQLVGEGTYNLARAFIQSGASSVVSTLWEVNDFHTADLVRRFYERLKIKGNPGEALLDAKIAFINETDEFGAHPFFWAGLVTYGI